MTNPVKGPSFLNLHQVLPVKDLRKLLYAKLDPYDRFLVMVAHGHPVGSLYDSFDFQMWCAQHGYLSLMPVSIPTSHIARIVEHAVINGQTNIVHQFRYSLTRCMSHVAAWAGQLEILQMMKNSTVGMYIDGCLCVAASRGHLHVLRWLVETTTTAVKPQCIDIAFDSAMEHGQTHIVDWLLDSGFTLPNVSRGKHHMVYQMQSGWPDIYRVNFKAQTN